MKRKKKKKGTESQKLNKTANYFLKKNRKIYFEFQDMEEV